MPHVTTLLNEQQQSLDIAPPSLSIPFLPNTPHTTPSVHHIFVSTGCTTGQILFLFFLARACPTQFFVRACPSASFVASPSHNHTTTILTSLLALCAYRLQPSEMCRPSLQRAVDAHSALQWSRADVELRNIDYGGHASLLSIPSLSLDLFVRSFWAQIDPKLRYCQHRTTACDCILMPVLCCGTTRSFFLFRSDRSKSTTSRCAWRNLLSARIGSCADRYVGPHVSALHCFVTLWNSLFEKTCLPQRIISRLSIP